MHPTIDELKTEGFTTVRDISEELNRREVETFRKNGQQWHATSVQRLLKRLKPSTNQKY